VQLLKMGFVDKANFDEEDRGKYERERRENSVIKERQEIEAKQREEVTKAYEEWVVQKDLRDSALKCLALVKKPVAEMPVMHDDPRGSATGLRRSTQQQAAATALGTITQRMFYALSCLKVVWAMARSRATIRACTSLFTSMLTHLFVLCSRHSHDESDAEPHALPALHRRGPRHEEGGPHHLPRLGEVVRGGVQHQHRHGAVGLLRADFL
jgi:hypothetical protein